MILEGRELTIGYSDRMVGDESRRRARHRRGAGAARAERRRQDHAAQDAARPARAESRRGAARRPAACAATATASARGSIAYVPQVAHRDLRVPGRDHRADGPHRARQPVQPADRRRPRGGGARAGALRHRASRRAALHHDLRRRAAARAARARAGAGAAVHRARRADREPRLRQPGQGDARDPRAGGVRPRRAVHHARSRTTRCAPPTARSCCARARGSARGRSAQVLNRAQLEALYGAPVEIVTDTATGTGAFLPG